MNISTRRAVALLTVAALAGSAATAMNALGHQDSAAAREGHDGHRALLFTSLVPSVPSDPTLLGAKAGGVPWVLRAGEAALSGNGRLDVRIRGLLIPSGQFAGTTGPVMTVSVSLYCAGSATPVGTSNAAPLSSDGDAQIATMVGLPAKCQIPAVLIHPNGSLGAYIATNGVAR